MSDVLITPASSKIEFKDASNNIDGVVKLDSDGNLELTSPGGGISFGDVSSDIFIGNGTDNVDLKFEVSGSITGTSGVTLTLGSSNSNIAIVSNNAVAVTGNVTPSSTNSYDLGSSSKRWNNLYVNDMHFSNHPENPNSVDGTWGDWTLQEGEDSIYMLNNRNGKKYKMTLTEVS